MGTFNTIRPVLLLHLTNFNFVYQFLGRSLFPSKWTLEDVYMETSFVLDGLSRKCDLKLLSSLNIRTACQSKLETDQLEIGAPPAVKIEPEKIGFTKTTNIEMDSDSEFDLEIASCSSSLSLSPRFEVLRGSTTHGLSSMKRSYSTGESQSYEPANKKHISMFSAEAHGDGTKRFYSESEHITIISDDNDGSGEDSGMKNAKEQPILNSCSPTVESTSSATVQREDFSTTGINSMSKEIPSEKDSYDTLETVIVNPVSPPDDNVKQSDRCFEGFSKFYGALSSSCLLASPVHNQNIHNSIGAQNNATKSETKPVSVDCAPKSFNSLTDNSNSDKDDSLCCSSSEEIANSEPSITEDSPLPSFYIINESCSASTEARNKIGQSGSRPPSAGSESPSPSVTSKDTGFSNKPNIEEEPNTLNLPESYESASSLFQDQTDENHGTVKKGNTKEASTYPSSQCQPNDSNNDCLGQQEPSGCNASIKEISVHPDADKAEEFTSDLQRKSKSSCDELLRSLERLNSDLRKIQELSSEAPNLIEVNSDTESDARSDTEKCSHINSSMYKSVNVDDTVEELTEFEHEKQGSSGSTVHTSEEQEDSGIQTCAETDSDIQHKPSCTRSCLEISCNAQQEFSESLNPGMQKSTRTCDLDKEQLGSNTDSKKYSDLNSLIGLENKMFSRTSSYISPVANISSTATVPENVQHDTPVPVKVLSDAQGQLELKVSETQTSLNITSNIKQISSGELTTSVQQLTEAERTQDSNDICSASKSSDTDENLQEHVDVKKCEALISPKTEKAKDLKGSERQTSSEDCYAIVGASDQNYVAQGSIECHSDICCVETHSDMQQSPNTDTYLQGPSKLSFKSQETSELTTDTKISLGRLYSELQQSLETSGNRQELVELETRDYLDCNSNKEKPLHKREMQKYSAVSCDREESSEPCVLTEEIPDLTSDRQRTFEAFSGSENCSNTHVPGQNFADDSSDECPKLGTLPLKSVNDSPDFQETSQLRINPPSVSEDSRSQCQHVTCDSKSEKCCSPVFASHKEQIESCESDSNEQASVTLKENKNQTDFTVKTQQQVLCSGDMKHSPTASSSIYNLFQNAEESSSDHPDDDCKHESPEKSSKKDADHNKDGISRDESNLSLSQCSHQDRSTLENRTTPKELSLDAQNSPLVKGDGDDNDRSTSMEDTSEFDEIVQNVVTAIAATLRDRNSPIVDTSEVIPIRRVNINDFSSLDSNKSADIITCSDGTLTLSVNVNDVPSTENNYGNLGNFEIASAGIGNVPKGTPTISIYQRSFSNPSKTFLSDTNSISTELVEPHLDIGHNGCVTERNSDTCKHVKTAAASASCTGLSESMDGCTKYDSFKGNSAQDDEPSNILMKSDCANDIVQQLSPFMQDDFISKQYKDSSNNEEPSVNSQERFDEIENSGSTKCVGKQNSCTVTKDSEEDNSCNMVSTTTLQSNIEEIHVSLDDETCTAAREQIKSVENVFKKRPGTENIHSELANDSFEPEMDHEETDLTTKSVNSDLKNDSFGPEMDREETDLTTKSVNSDLKNDSFGPEMDREETDLTTKSVNSDLKTYSFGPEMDREETDSTTKSVNSGFGGGSFGPEMDREETDLTTKSVNSDLENYSFGPEMDREETDLTTKSVNSDLKNDSFGPEMDREETDLTTKSVNSDLKNDSFGPEMDREETDLTTKSVNSDLKSDSFGPEMDREETDLTTKSVNSDLKNDLFTSDSVCDEISRNAAHVDTDEVKLECETDVNLTNINDHGITAKCIADFEGEKHHSSNIETDDEDPQNISRQHAAPHKRASGLIQMVDQVIKDCEKTSQSGSDVTRTDVIYYTLPGGAGNVKLKDLQGPNRDIPETLMEVDCRRVTSSNEYANNSLNSEFTSLESTNDECKNSSVDSTFPTTLMRVTSSSCETIIQDQDVSITVVKNDPDLDKRNSLESPSNNVMKALTNAATEGIVALSNDSKTTGVSSPLLGFRGVSVDEDATSAIKVLDSNVSHASSSSSCNNKFASGSHELQDNTDVSLCKRTNSCVSDIELGCVEEVVGLPDNKRKGRTRKEGIFVNSECLIEITSPEKSCISKQISEDTVENSEGDSLELTFDSPASSYSEDEITPCAQNDKSSEDIQENVMNFDSCQSLVTDPVFSTNGSESELLRQDLDSSSLHPVDNYISLSAKDHGSEFDVVSESDSDLHKPFGSIGKFSRISESAPVTEAVKCEVIESECERTSINFPVVNDSKRDLSVPKFAASTSSCSTNDVDFDLVKDELVVKDKEDGNNYLSDMQDLVKELSNIEKAFGLSNPEKSSQPDTDASSIEENELDLRSRENQEVQVKINSNIKAEEPSSNTPFHSGTETHLNTLTRSSVSLPDLDISDKAIGTKRKLPFALPECDKKLKRSDENEAKFDKIFCGSCVSNTSQNNAELDQADTAPDSDKDVCKIPPFSVADKLTSNGKKNFSALCLAGISKLKKRLSKEEHVATQQSCEETNLGCQAGTNDDDHSPVTQTFDHVEQKQLDTPAAVTFNDLNESDSTTQHVKENGSEEDGLVNSSNVTSKANVTFSDPFEARSSLSTIHSSKESIDIDFSAELQLTDTLPSKKPLTCITTTLVAKTHTVHSENGFLSTEDKTSREAPKIALNKKPCTLPVVTTVPLVSQNAECVSTSANESTKKWDDTKYFHGTNDFFCGAEVEISNAEREQNETSFIPLTEATTVANCLTSFELTQEPSNTKPKLEFPLPPSETAGASAGNDSAACNNLLNQLETFKTKSSCNSQTPSDQMTSETVSDSLKADGSSSNQLETTKTECSCDSGAPSDQMTSETMSDRLETDDSSSNQLESKEAQSNDHSYILPHQATSDRINDPRTVGTNPIETELQDHLGMPGSSLNAPEPTGTEFDHNHDKPPYGELFYVDYDDGAERDISLNDMEMETQSNHLCIELETQVAFEIPDEDSKVGGNSVNQLEPPETEYNAISGTTSAPVKCATVSGDCTPVSQLESAGTHCKYNLRTISNNTSDKNCSTCEVHPGDAEYFHDLDTSSDETTSEKLDEETASHVTLGNQLEPLCGRSSSFMLGLSHLKQRLKTKVDTLQQKEDTDVNQKQNSCSESESNSDSDSRSDDFEYYNAHNRSIRSKDVDYKSPEKSENHDKKGIRTMCNTSDKSEPVATTSNPTNADLDSDSDSSIEITYCYQPDPDTDKSGWGESADLPLMANVDEVLVTHYILDLDVSFGKKIIEGSIVLFLRPANEEAKSRNFQLCLDSTLVSVGAVEEIELPDDFKVHFHKETCCCQDTTPVSSESIEPEPYTDISNCKSCSFLHDLRNTSYRESQLKFKKLEYSLHGWCIRIWKEGDENNQWPECVRIWYRTNPEGQSISWALDQDGK